MSHGGSPDKLDPVADLRRLADRVRRLAREMTVTADRDRFLQVAVEIQAEVAAIEAEQAKPAPPSSL